MHIWLPELQAAPKRLAIACSKGRVSELGSHRILLRRVICLEHTADVVASLFLRRNFAIRLKFEITEEALFVEEDAGIPDSGS